MMRYHGLGPMFNSYKKKYETLLQDYYLLQCENLALENENNDLKEETLSLMSDIVEDGGIVHSTRAAVVEPQQDA